jgi:hypothetical protein
MRSTTLFRLQSQTTRLIKRLTRLEQHLGNKYGIVTLYDVLFQITYTHGIAPVTTDRKTTILKAQFTRGKEGPTDLKFAGTFENLPSLTLNEYVCILYPPKLRSSQI